MGGGEGSFGEMGLTCLRALRVVGFHCTIGVPAWELLPFTVIHDTDDVMMISASHFCDSGRAYVHDHIGGFAALRNVNWKAENLCKTCISRLKEKWRAGQEQIWDELSTDIGEG